MHDHVLERIEDPELRVYAVWESILRSDNERAARKAVSLLPDPRVTHFWAPSEDLPLLFQNAISLSRGPAWDVYLIYPPGVTWTDQPPEPKRFMHQLPNLPDEFLLNGDKLGAWVREVTAPEAGKSP